MRENFAMNLEANILNNKSICRVCLQSFRDEDFVNLDAVYDEEKELTYSSCFFACTEIDLQEANGMPCRLCGNCCLELQMTYDFHKKVRNSNEILDKLVLREEETTVDYYHPDEYDASESETETNDVVSEEETKVFENMEELIAWEEQNIVVEAIADVPELDLPPVVESPEETTKDNKKQSVKQKTSDVVPLKCEICHKIFSKPLYLRRHVKIHDPEDIPSECSICRKVFSKPYYLRRHLLTHDPDRKKFECPECDKVFLTRWMQMVHIRSHRGDGLLCPVCSKVFYEKKDFSVHMRFHTGDFPFICEVCGRRFPLKGHLNTHVSNKHNGLCLTCKECGKIFQTPSSLTAHSFTHTGMPFQCAYCPKQYPLRHKLKMHIKTKHGFIANDEELNKMRRFKAERLKHTWTKVDKIGEMSIKSKQT